MAERRKARRGLAVLADGAQAAFAAGAVAELARNGAAWSVACGAGLGAQVAVLALLCEAAEAERRWRRQAESGCPLLASAVAAARAHLGARRGISVGADAWALPGWLDPEELAEHLAPEMAGVPERLRKAGARCAVAVGDLVTGVVSWVELSELEARDAGAALIAAASFPAGWPAAAGSGRLAWGGVGLVGDAAWMAGADAWDVVCGFPVPPAARPGLGDGLLELVQRREEIRAGTVVSGWVSEAVRVIAPTAEGYARWAARDGADLGTEYPLPWERNGELVGQLVDLGAFAARHAAPARRSRRSS
jgi:hypothetical protein